jgi:hypothetical protein
LSGDETEFDLEDEAQRQADEIAQLRDAVARQAQVKSELGEEARQALLDEEKAERQAKEIAELRAMVAKKAGASKAKGVDPHSPESSELSYAEDPDDPALQRYKASLLGPPAAPIDPSNPIRVLCHSMVVESVGRPPVVLPMGVLSRKSAPHTIVIKEGATYRIGEHPHKD